MVVQLRHYTLIVLLLSTIMVFMLIGTLHAFDNQIERVSISSAGAQGNNGSNGPAISADGQFVVFSSDASNLVPGDTNNVTDVFVHDRQTGTTERISVSSTGQQGNGYSYSHNHSISANGRYVVFQSSANTLVSGDTNGTTYDVFVHDRQTGETTRVSVSTTGQQGNLESSKATISADGRYVVFDSGANNLVPGDTNSTSDVFIHDRQTGETRRVSVSSTGQQANGASNWAQISGNGRYVVFQSLASNLDTNDTTPGFDTYIRNLQTSETWQVSVSSAGASSDGGGLVPSISGNGRFVAFASAATNLVANDTNGLDDVFVHDIQTGETTRVSVSSSGVEGNGLSEPTSVSDDGRFVVFGSYASNLVENDMNGTTDVFIHDRQTGETMRVSVSGLEEEGNGLSNSGEISDNGDFIAFRSFANNLVADDTNNYADNFVALNPFPVLDPPTPTPVSTNPPMAINAAPIRHYYDSIPVELTWSQVSWAAAYEIQVSVNSDFTGTLDYSAMVSNTRQAVTIFSLSDGTYYWRVRAQNSTGAWRAWSPTQQFTLNTS